MFTNYVVSLDGRIAVPSGDGNVEVPAAIANPRDWRLLQELQAQSDIVISSGRYLREYAAGDAQENLDTLSQPEYADLAAYRQDHGLKPVPDICIVSVALDFNIPQILLDQGRRIIIVTPQPSDPDRIQRLQDQGGEIVHCPGQEVDGDHLYTSLSDMGYQVIFAASGPKINHILMAARRVDRLYLTFAHRLLGGDPFASIAQGPAFAPPVDFKLRSLYLDAEGLDGIGQLFGSYEGAQAS